MRIHELPPELNEDTIWLLACQYKEEPDPRVIETLVSGMARKVYVWCYRERDRESSYTLGLETVFLYVDKAILCCQSGVEIIKYLHTAVLNRLKDQAKVGSWMKVDRNVDPYLLSDRCTDCYGLQRVVEMEELLDYLELDEVGSTVIRMLDVGYKRHEIIAWLRGVIGDGVNHRVLYDRYNAVLETVRRRVR